MEDLTKLVLEEVPNTVSSKASDCTAVAREEGESPNPPFEIQYKNLLQQPTNTVPAPVPVVEECELPLIDLNHLRVEGSDSDKQAACKKLISRASQEWGFFQVINHGISDHLLASIRSEQIALLNEPFHHKANSKQLNLGTYQWGTPTANSLQHLSWSESFHVPLNLVLGSPPQDKLRSTMEQFAAAVWELAQTLAAILAEEIGHQASFFTQTCLPGSCYLRLNRYPRCPTYPRVLGIAPHTDSDFLTVLHQDTTGGLQLVKNGKWIAVTPNPRALIINIGDLLQAWSNDVYKSVEHRVMANAKKDRYSTAYFLCPSYDTVIDSTVYRSFTFRDYKKQVQEDVKVHGYKIGLSRFLLI